MGLSSALLMSSPALASGPRDGDVTPDSANTARFGIEQQGSQLSDAGAYDQAAELYWAKGIELADPVLIIDAAEAWREHAAKQRSIAAAQTAIDRVQLALDMLFFLRDSAGSASWQPVAPEYLSVLIERAQSVVTDAGSLVAEIEAEQLAAAQAAAEPAAEPIDNKRGPAKPGTGLIAGGSAALVLGLGGAGLGVAGLALGANAQTDVEDPTVYEPEHSAAQARGRTGNTLAGVGLAVAIVGVSVGAALIVLGRNKRKPNERKPAPDQASAQLSPLLDFSGHRFSGAGLSVRGRF